MEIQVDPLGSRRREVLGLPDPVADFRHRQGLRHRGAGVGVHDVREHVRRVFQRAFRQRLVGEGQRHAADGIFRRKRHPPVLRRAIHGIVPVLRVVVVPRRGVRRAHVEHEIDPVAAPRRVVDRRPDPGKVLRHGQRRHLLPAVAADEQVDVGGAGQRPRGGGVVDRDRIAPVGLGRIQPDVAGVRVAILHVHVPVVVVMGVPPALPVVEAHVQAVGGIAQAVGAGPNPVAERSQADVGIDDQFPVVLADVGEDLRGRRQRSVRRLVGEGDFGTAGGLRRREVHGGMATHGHVPVLGEVVVPRGAAAVGERVVQAAGAAREIGIGAKPQVGVVGRARHVGVERVLPAVVADEHADLRRPGQGTAGRIVGKRNRLVAAVVLGTGRRRAARGRRRLGKDQRRIASHVDVRGRRRTGGHDGRRPDIVEIAVVIGLVAVEMRVPRAGGRKLDAVVVVGPGRNAEIGHHHHVVAARIPALVGDDLVGVVDVVDVAVRSLEPLRAPFQVAPGVDQRLVGGDVPAVVFAARRVPAVAGAVGERPVLHHFLALEDHRNAGRRHVHRGRQQRPLARPVARRIVRIDQLGQARVAVQVAGGVVRLHVEDPAQAGAAVDQARQRVHVAVGIARFRHQRAQVLHEIHVPAAVEAPRRVAVLLDRHHVRIVVVDARVAGLHQADAVGVARRAAAGVVIADVERRIRAEAVHAEMVEPRRVIVLDVVADFRRGVVRPGRAPVRAAQPRGIVVVDAAVLRDRRVAVELPRRQIAGSPVVVDHVQDDRHLAGMAGVDEFLQLARAAVGAFHGVGIRRVVAPAVVAREFHDRHQLDRVDAQFLQVAELGDRRVERALRPLAPLRTERPDVHGVNDFVLALRPRERIHVPIVGVRSEHDAVAGGIHHAQAARIPAPQIAVDHVFVFDARRGVRAIRGPVAVAFAGQRVGAHVPAIEIAGDGDVGRVRRPHPERHASDRARRVRNRPHAGAAGLRRRGMDQQARQDPRRRANGQPSIHGTLLVMRSGRIVESLQTS